MSNPVREMFSAISPTYDRMNRVLSIGLDRGWRRKAVRMIRRAPVEVLDLCCGTGDFALELLGKFPQARVTAADFSEAMLEVARRKAGRELSAGSLVTVLADALDLPFASESFDAVICAFGVRNFDDAARGLQEIRRILRPGGELVILEFFRPTTPLGRLFGVTYGRYVLPHAGRRLSGHPAAYAYLRDSIRGFLSLAEFEELLRSAGFGEVRIRRFFMSVATAVAAVKMREAS